MAMTVQTLIEILEDFDPDAFVNIAFQPNWPMQNPVGEVVQCETAIGTEVFIGETGSNTYLDPLACYELGWGPHPDEDVSPDHDTRHKDGY